MQYRDLPDHWLWQFDAHGNLLEEYVLKYSAPTCTDESSDYAFLRKRRAQLQRDAFEHDRRARERGTDHEPNV